MKIAKNRILLNGFYLLINYTTVGCLIAEIQKEYTIYVSL